MREERERVAIWPYVSFFGLFVLLASLVAPTLAANNGVDAPEWLGRALAVTGVVLMLAWPVFSFRDFKELMSTRQARYGGNALILTIAVVGILGLANYFGTLRFRTWDLTENQRFSISPQSVQILDSLEQSGQAVKLTAVLGRDMSAQAAQLERLVDQYQRSTNILSYERLDPQLDLPEMMGLAASIGEQSPPNRALVAQSGDKHAIVYSFDEQSVTEAIVKATRQEDLRVSFTTGHGEHSPTGGGAEGSTRGYTGVRQALEREGYTVDTINLATISDTIEADVIIVAGPQTPFLPAEVERLQTFIEEGGAAMLLLDPLADAGLGELLAAWEIRAGDDLVIQPASPLGPAFAFVGGSDYQFHTITKDLAEFNAIFPQTQSFQVGTPVDSNLVTTSLVEISGNGVYGETDFEALQSGQVTEDESDNAGPLSLGVAGESTAEEGGRIVVFGTSELAADATIGGLGGIANGDIFLNGINWLSQEESLISIRPTEPDNRPISPPQNAWLLLISTAVLIPLVVGAIGFWVWWGRR